MKNPDTVIDLTLYSDQTVRIYFAETEKCITIDFSTKFGIEVSTDDEGVDDPSLYRNSHPWL